MEPMATTSRVALPDQQAQLIDPLQMDNTNNINSINNCVCFLFFYYTPRYIFL